MRNVREELQLVDGVRQTLGVLRTRAEMLPVGHSVRVTVETYLQTVERQVSEEHTALRQSLSGEYSA